jgi:hypothetical protein
MNTNPIITKKQEEFDALIGPPPAILEDYRDQVCFVCGQPFNKSPQLDKLKAFLTEALTEAYEAGKKDALLEDVKTAMEVQMDEQYEVAKMLFMKQLRQEAQRETAREIVEIIASVHVHDWGGGEVIFKPDLTRALSKYL